MIAKLELTRDELQILVATLDAGTKAAGLQIVVPLAPILAKIEEAGKVFAQPNGADMNEPEIETAMKGEL